MPEEQGRISIAVAVERTDWTRYAGQASYVKQRGERRRRMLRAAAALGTTLAVVAVAVAANALGTGSVAQQGASPASASPASDYPTFPAKLPTKPVLFSNRDVVQSGVIGAGAVSGHQWQISYRVISSGSVANGQQQENNVDATLDGRTLSIGGAHGAVLGPQGYIALNQYFESTGSLNAMVVAFGTPTPGVTSVDLRRSNGTVIPIPIHTATGTRFASFAWNPANPPAAVEQVSANGVQKITISHNGDEIWYLGANGPGIKLPSPVPGTPPSYLLEFGSYGEYRIPLMNQTHYTWTFTWPN